MEDKELKPFATDNNVDCKEVEEMTKVFDEIEAIMWENAAYDTPDMAKSFYNAGYRNVKDKVVMSKEEWANLQGKAWASTFKDAEISQLKEELKQVRNETAGALLSELCYITRFYYGNSANVLAWAREKAEKLGVEIKE